MVCPGIRKGGGGAKIEQLMSCGVPSIKTLYIIIYLLLVLSFPTFHKKMCWGGGGLNHLANSSTLKKINNPPQTSIFILFFLYKFFSFTFQKIYIYVLFFFLGGEFTTWPSHPFSKKICSSITYVHIHNIPNIYFHLPSFSFYLFHPFSSSFSFYLFSFTFQKKIFFFGGGEFTTWPTHPLLKNCN